VFIDPPFEGRFETIANCADARRRAPNDAPVAAAAVSPTRRRDGNPRYSSAMIDAFRSSTTHVMTAAKTKVARAPSRFRGATDIDAALETANTRLRRDD